MVLEMKDINKSFGAKQVLKGVSFRAEGGSAFGLLGRNGAGKTTSIRILMDVFPADSGQVLLDGKPVDYGKIGLGYLPEERGLYPKKLIGEQLVYLARLKGMGKKAAEQAVDFWLKRLGMEEHKNKRLDTLSKGNQQKIQLITALAHDPEIIVLDEPFSGLDPVNAQLLKDVVKEQIGKGKIVLFSSHQMNYIEEFCDSIAILHQGEVVLSGNLRDIKRSFPRDRLVVRTQSPEKIQAAFPCTQGEKGELILLLKAPEEKQAVMQRLTRDFDIDGVEVFEPSLNDIFVAYTKEGQA
ncbi:MAG TPA: ATP-binding cassette domain-containing protein [Candidatus Faecousia excrementigallinarum]|uniref:ATP-binding cassette domain-containing protein n=1 Tax=Candidatus Faecousia excrementigallinarum TaxID=2840806 RepID=A0A9D0Z265_9FIRM|nr:ATP-binding cassette domain-containing protein [Candidatus Faecousia excrementigallinarum]